MRGQRRSPYINRDQCTAITAVTHSHERESSWTLMATYRTHEHRCARENVSLCLTPRAEDSVRSKRYFLVAAIKVKEYIN